MSDLEIVRACAEAMFPDNRVKNALEGVFYEDYPGVWVSFEPLTNDAQAFQLMKRLSINVWGSDISANEWKWHACWNFQDTDDTLGNGDTPNRAICECVAKMRAKP